MPIWWYGLVVSVAAAAWPITTPVSSAVSPSAGVPLTSTVCAVFQFPPLPPLKLRTAVAPKAPEPVRSCTAGSPDIAVTVTAVPGSVFRTAVYVSASPLSVTASVRGLTVTPSALSSSAMVTV